MNALARGGAPFGRRQGLPGTNKESRRRSSCPRPRCILRSTGT